jgi:hypothetical protein
MNDTSELIRSEGEKTRRAFDRFAELIQKDIYAVLIGLTDPAEIDRIRQKVFNRSLFDSVLADYEERRRQLEKRE